MIKYIGSKRTLVPQIVTIAKELAGVHTACDIFTGTTRVAQGLKAAGLHVTTNDLASYSHQLGICYIENDDSNLDRSQLNEKIEHLNSLQGEAGYFTENFAYKAKYFQPHNAERIDRIREEIELITNDRHEKAVLLVSLMEAADRVDSTTGLQMAYLKKWSPRSYNDLELRLPNIPAGPAGSALQGDANELAKNREYDFDLVYIDPPYNQHSYYSNYHIWETLIRNDQPEGYGIANKRIDCQTTKSDYNSKRRAWDTFTDLMTSIRARYLLVSFNNEGYFSADEIITLLETKGEAAYLPIAFKRYVGAQIGIHNLRGERVGRVSHLNNKEYLFLVGDGAAELIERLKLSSAPSSV